ncbi:hypothetical protein COP2_038922 [Malus domestica]
MLSPTPNRRQRGARGARQAVQIQGGDRALRHLRRNPGAPAVVPCSSGAMRARRRLILRQWRLEMERTVKSNSIERIAL